jgi:hypothetical protein
LSDEAWEFFATFSEQSQVGAGYYLPDITPALIATLPDGQRTEFGSSTFTRLPPGSSLERRLIDLMESRVANRGQELPQWGVLMVPCVILALPRNQDVSELDLFSSAGRVERLESAEMWVCLDEDGVLRPTRVRTEFLALTPSGHQRMTVEKVTDRYSRLVDRGNRLVAQRVRERLGDAMGVISRFRSTFKSNTGVPSPKEVFTEQSEHLERTAGAMGGAAQE